MSHYAIRTRRHHTPFLWTSDQEFAERIARRADGGQVIGPLPDEEAHALGMSYTGRFAGPSVVDFGIGLIYLPEGEF